MTISQGLLLESWVSTRRLLSKARYEFLKDYKQGLLIDADEDEKIELYEESLVEAKASLSIARTNVEP
ncbi:hypothetical protein TIFTF001_025266 [Ficus carica]|uniref:Uncharacterized protein n=1 Tax=Ficus carica TaxID=3494 RepID=A0AA88ANX1_FICCA|nr:hypothetical protein TIFTF001_025266 [Ficus carica]